MASKVPKCGEPEQDKDESEVGGIYWSDHLDGPIIEVRFRWDEPEGYDSYVVCCPYCDGETHRHAADKYPRVALGGIGQASCEASGERYYLLLAPNGTGVTTEYVHLARRGMTNLPGNKLRMPLIPKGIDPRVIDDLIPGWSDC